MSAEFLLAPIRGTTSLWRLTWLYGIVGSAVLEIAGVLVAGSNEQAQRLMLLVGLGYGIYLTIATYRCAANSRWPRLAPLIRGVAVISLLLMPLMAYVVLSGDLAGVIKF